MSKGLCDPGHITRREVRVGKGFRGKHVHGGPAKALGQAGSAVTVSLLWQNGFTKWKTSECSTIDTYLATYVLYKFHTCMWDVYMFVHIIIAHIHAVAMKANFLLCFDSWTLSSIRRISKSFNRRVRRRNSLQVHMNLRGHHLGHHDLDRLSSNREESCLVSMFIWSVRRSWGDSVTVTRNLWVWHFGALGWSPLPGSSYYCLPSTEVLKKSQQTHSALAVLQFQLQLPKQTQSTPGMVSKPFVCSGPR